VRYLFNYNNIYYTYHFNMNAMSYSIIFRHMSYLYLQNFIHAGKDGIKWKQKGATPRNEKYIFIHYILYILNINTLWPSLKKIYYFIPSLSNFWFRPCMQGEMRFEKRKNNNDTGSTGVELSMDRVETIRVIFESVSYYLIIFINLILFNYIWTILFF
jgi:hypothetical protein